MVLGPEGMKYEAETLLESKRSCLIFHFMTCVSFLTLKKKKKIHQITLPKYVSRSLAFPASTLKPKFVMKSTNITLFLLWKVFQYLWKPFLLQILLKQLLMFYG